MHDAPPVCSRQYECPAWLRSGVNPVGVHPINGMCARCHLRAAVDALGDALRAAGVPDESPAWDAWEIAEAYQGSQAIDLQAKWDHAAFQLAVEQDKVIAELAKVVPVAKEVPNASR